MIPKTKEIKIRMIDLQLKQNDLAEQLGLTKIYVNALINGRETSWRQAYRLSKCLGGTIDDYFTVED
ncbi:helix-turn-helix transcriptional regulator [Mammaliicoccus sciuri]|uniref:helix-turn-helix transcriptional regulator n=1 Tax=Mammaliicoccus sciuri TaxID=1296 RepID=UPI000CD03894|nr:helix-turn-helix transcriptional regulator [Mammaliicoccus sciuri]PNZ30034.1 hypothetical protein CD114_01390 [Mammaliicoccus sciuri]